VGRFEIIVRTRPPPARLDPTSHTCNSYSEKNRAVKTDKSFQGFQIRWVIVPGCGGDLNHAEHVLSPHGLPSWEVQPAFDGRCRLRRPQDGETGEDPGQEGPRNCFHGIGRD
jgi:hypothetical protein